MGLGIQGEIGEHWTFTEQIKKGEGVSKPIIDTEIGPLRVEGYSNGVLKIFYTDILEPRVSCKLTRMDYTNLEGASKRIKEAMNKKKGDK